MIDETLVRGGSNFVRGPKPAGFGVQFHKQPDGLIRAVTVLEIEKKGPPDHAHGGALVALVDEAMGMAAWVQGHRVLAVNLNIDFRRGVPLDREITITGWVDRAEGRKVFTKGTIALPEGTVAVEATGIFVEAPQYVGEEKFDPLADLVE